MTTQCGLPTPASKTPPSAIAALILGICGLVILPLFSPFAWHYAIAARRKISENHLDGGGLATAGLVLGIIGTAILAFVCALVAIGFAIAGPF